ncbi:ABC transporter substrate-binding protein (plasmid) [Rhodococcus pyridinivorans]|uniref:ABC transporter substrate-binding protein n=1 Tax=Rhodococcus pyridinivorans TaxID=103816 RepID=UPI00200AB6F6|nr:ABC transporter substrate-binding protein [Rhodococcus pyridinivorans]UPW06914.1 ABC transporter substrate-binding protein [Rhodococcus pyridinivorans]
MRSRLAASAALFALMLTGCSTTDTPAPKNSVASATDGTSYPMTLTNCGVEVTVPAPPQRAVALNQGAAEILLSLGLADRMIGTATWTDPVRENLADDNARVPRLAENNPSIETVLDTEPDFVSASFGGTLGPGGVADRAQFAQLGVPTYLSPTDCDGIDDSSVNADGNRTTPLAMDTVYQEIRELAAIFDVRERGEQLVAALQSRYDAAANRIAASQATLAFWFADTSTPYVAGCCGSSGIITAAVGAKNVFDDTTSEWPQVSWETVLDRNPTALVLADLSRRSLAGDALDSKIEFLETNPVTAQLTAVRHRHYIVVNGADLNPSIRTVDGIEKVADALEQWGYRR